MKDIVKFTFMIILFLPLTVYSADNCGPFGCVFQPGTTCVDGKCILKDAPTPTPTAVPTLIPTPTPTPTPNLRITEIKLKSIPLKDITPITLPCSKYDSVNLEVYLTRVVPPTPAAYFSAMIYKDAVLGTNKTSAYFARKDILNRLVFIGLDEGGKLYPQFHGSDFVFTQWKNIAFTEILKTIPCEKLASTGATLMYGIAFKEDFSDFEGASFTFGGTQ